MCNERIKLRRSWFAVIENEYGRSKERGLTSGEKIPSKGQKVQREGILLCMLNHDYDRVTRPANGTQGSDMLASNRILSCSSALNSKFVSLNNCSCFLNTSANVFLYGTVESLKIRLFLVTGLPGLSSGTGAHCPSFVCKTL